MNVITQADMEPDKLTSTIAALAISDDTTPITPTSMGRPQSLSRPDTPTGGSDKLSRPTTPRSFHLSSYPSSSTLINIVQREGQPPNVTMNMSTKRQETKFGCNIDSCRTDGEDNMVYSDYGELETEHILTCSVCALTSADMSVTQSLRAIKRGFGNIFKKRLGKIMRPEKDGKVSEEGEDGDSGVSRLSTWNFKAISPLPIASTIPDEEIAVPIYHGPLRVLEIGCSDGSWCFDFKRAHPDCIVEGINDEDYWTSTHKDTIIRDFMVPNSSSSNSSNTYFATHGRQKNPEFTVRNINHLLAHPNPIPQNLYEFIRARDVFDKVQNLPYFLAQVRTLLKPNGVVEFIELDPRPRAFLHDPLSPHVKNESVTCNDWTESVGVRFKEQVDKQLATTVPGWTERVHERLKASMIPLRDSPGGIAANLKSWIEGAGFWEVKEVLMRIPVGGQTSSGQLLKDFLMYQTVLENQIPKLEKQLPPIEIDALESGSYFLNVHVITGYKPNNARPGDLLRNGDRLEMTGAKYDAMARNVARTSLWRRYDDDLDALIEQLAFLPASPRSAPLPGETASNVVPPLTPLLEAVIGVGQVGESERMRHTEQPDLMLVGRSSDREVQRAFFRHS